MNGIKSIEEVIKYDWETEMEDFCEQFEVEIQSQDDLDKWINICENERPEMKNHVFYHLMVSRKFIDQLTDILNL